MSEREREAERLRTESAGMDERKLLRLVAREYAGRILFATSLGAEDQVVTHLLAETAPDLPIVTLDTGRLPQETYDLIEATRRFFGREIRVLFPDAAAVESLVRERGDRTSSTRESPSARRAATPARFCRSSIPSPGSRPGLRECAVPSR